MLAGDYSIKATRLMKQIKEIKEVIELPIKRPEFFENVGIAQPKDVARLGHPQFQRDAPLPWKFLTLVSSHSSPSFVCLLVFRAGRKLAACPASARPH
jgi:hypothetical protein